MIIGRHSINGEMITVDGVLSSINGEMSSIDGEMIATGGVLSSINGDQNSIDGVPSGIDREMIAINGDQNSIDGVLSCNSGDQRSKLTEADRSIAQNYGKPTP